MTPIIFTNINERALFPAWLTCALRQILVICLFLSACSLEVLSVKSVYLRKIAGFCDYRQKNVLGRVYLFEERDYARAAARRDQFPADEGDAPTDERWWVVFITFFLLYTNNGLCEVLSQSWISYTSCLIYLRFDVLSK